MIKKLLLVAALILPMFASAQSLKFGVVDMNEILAAMPETTAAQNQLQETQKKYENEFAKIEEELQKQVTELQNMKEDELPAIRERKVKEFQDTQAKAEAFQQNAYNDLQKLQNDLMGPIIQKINQAIEAVGKENSFSGIQEKAGFIYYAAPVEDVTSLVKGKLGL